MSVTEPWGLDREGIHRGGVLKILGNTHLVVIQGILTMKPPLLSENVSALVTVKFLECHHNLEQVMIKQHDVYMLRGFSFFHCLRMEQTLAGTLSQDDVTKSAVMTSSLKRSNLVLTLVSKYGPETVPVCIHAVFVVLSLCDLCVRPRICARKSIADSFADTLAANVDINAHYINMHR